MEKTTTGIQVSMAALMMAITLLAPVAFADPGVSGEHANDRVTTATSLEEVLGPDDDDDDDDGDDRRPCRPHCLSLLE